MRNSTSSMKNIMSRITVFLVSMVIMLSSMPLDSIIVAKGADEQVITEDTELLEYQTKSAYPSEDMTEKVALDGMMPVESDLVVSRTDNTVPAETICSYDIAIMNKGKEYQPDSANPINVSITNSAIGEASAAEKPLTLWHISDDGSVTEIKDFTIDGDTISFIASGFSVYYITDEGPVRTYEFYTPDESGTYVKYYYSTNSAQDSSGEEVKIWRQTIKNGEKLTIPQLPSVRGSATSTFMGWYVLDNNNNPTNKFDFDNIPPITETETEPVKLGAVFANCAYVIFHEQYNAANDSWPIAATRRGELTGSNNEASIQIDDITVTYDDSSSEDDQNQNKSPQMLFRGWSKQECTHPGSTTDDEGDPIVIEENPITINANTHLYPVFSNIRWLSFVSGETGSGATYISPKYYFLEDGTAKLPGKDEMTRPGYVFDGWFTDAIGGTKITDADGNIDPAVGNISGTNLAVSSDRKLIIKEDTTLYAHWNESNTTYTVVIWRQKATDEANSDDKHYDFAESFPVSSITGSVISQPDAQYKNKAGTTGYEGFHYSNCDTNVEVKGDGSSVVNVYYDRNVHTFTFRYDSRTVKTIQELYGANLVKYFPIIGDNGSSYNGYDWTATNTQVYNYAMATIEKMPDADVTFNGRWRGTDKTIYYYAEINPDLPYMYTGETRTFNGKTYELYKTVNHNFNFLTYDEEYHPIEGYIRSRTNAYPTFGTHNNNQNEANIGSDKKNYLYYDRATSHIEFRNTKNNSGANTDTLIEDRSVLFNERVSDYIIDTPEPPLGYKFKGWYTDAACTTKVFFSEPSYEDIHYIDENGVEQEINYQVYERMPSYNIQLFAGWEIEEYLVELDPNGGVLPETASTWFWLEYGEKVESYDNVTRNYIEDPRGTYFYHVLDRAAYGLGSEKEDREKDLSRTSYYSDDLDNAVDFTRYKYMQGAYRFAGCYEVNPVTGEETLYKFGEPIRGNLKFRLHWKRVGTYYITYNTVVDGIQGELDSADSNEVDVFKLLDEADYADHSSVVVGRTAIPPDGYNFIGWKIRKDPSDRIYYPGEAFEFNSAFADDVVDSNGNKKSRIFLDAVYREVKTATIIYDANGGTIDSNAVDYGETLLPLDANDMHPRTSCTDTQATITDLYDNSPIRLSSGAGFSYGSYEFCGWNTEPDGSGTHFDKGSISADPNLYVDTQEPVTLYAEWKIRVWFDKNKDRASWGSGWVEPKYKSENGMYYTEIYLNSKLEAPVGVPSLPANVQDVNNTFRYWTTDRYNDNAQPYEFGQPVTGEMTLYGFWTGEIKVPVHAVDASDKTLVIKDLEWRIKPEIPIKNDIVDISDDTYARVYVNPHDDEGNSYSFAFACVCDKKTAPNSISEDKKIDYLYYNPTDTNVWVHYSASADKPQGEDKQLGNDEEVYIVYYKDPSTVPIYYKDMAPSGGLTDTTLNSQVPDNAKEAEIHQTPYEMKNYVTLPRDWANKTNSNDFYSFAIGDPNATNASQLHTITQASSSDASRPDLRVMNTWRGYKYSVDGGNTWNDAGYDIALYVVYYDSQPTIVNLNEKTIGLAGDMSKEFTYTVKITETTTTQTIRKYYYYSTYRGPETLVPEVSTTILPQYSLSLTDSMSESITLFSSSTNSTNTVNETGYYNNNRNRPYNYYTDEITTTITQKVEIIQTADPLFSTEITKDHGSFEDLTYTFTTDNTPKEVTVTYTNKREPVAKVIHAAIAGAGKITNADNDIRTDVSAVYTHNMSLDDIWNLESGGMATNLLKVDARDEYVFAGIAAGKPAENGEVNVSYDPITELDYEVIDENHNNIYDFYLDNDKDKLLEDNEIYFIYYKKPKIKYVIEEADGKLKEITEPFKRKGEILDKILGQTLKQNNVLDVDGELVVSNGSGNGLYRVPPDLDGLTQTSLKYEKIGAGKPGVGYISGLDTVSDDLELRLGIHDHQIMYRLTADGEWQVFSGEPTVYIIYHETTTPAVTGIGDVSEPYEIMMAIILLAGIMLLFIRKKGKTEFISGEIDNNSECRSKTSEKFEIISVEPAIYEIEPASNPPPYDSAISDIAVPHGIGKAAMSFTGISLLFIRKTGKLKFRSGETADHSDRRYKESKMRDAFSGDPIVYEIEPASDPPPYVPVISDNAVTLINKIAAMLFKGIIPIFICNRKEGKYYETNPL